MNIPKFRKNKNAYTLALCEGRHTMPAEVQGSIFPAEVDPTDLGGLTEYCQKGIPATCNELTLYVTGLSVALLAVVRYCDGNGISLTCMHYNRDTGEYYPQKVLTYITCPHCGYRMPSTAWHCPGCGAS